jgi:Phage integrase family
VPLMICLMPRLVIAGGHGDGRPHAVKPGLCLGNVLTADRIRVVSLLVVEHGGVLAHQVIYRDALAVQRHRVLGNRVEPEERLGPVQDVELEHRRRAMHSDLRRGRFHQPQVGQLGDGLGDRLGMPSGDLLRSFPERWLVGQVADAARDGPRLAGVRDQDPDVDALRLARRHVDLEACTVRVVCSLTETDNGVLVLGPPKSAAGRRTVQLPPLVIPGLRQHLGQYALPGPDGLVFVGLNGALLRRSNFRRRIFLPALARAGLPEIHFHDLRHTGNVLTASAGASLRELMARMGHASARAALVYLHDTEDRQRTIAASVSDLASQELKQPDASPDSDTAEGSGT